MVASVRDTPTPPLRMVNMNARFRPFQENWFRQEPVQSGLVLPAYHIVSGVPSLGALCMTPPLSEGVTYGEPSSLVARPATYISPTGRPSMSHMVTPEVPPTLSRVLT